MKTRIHLLSLLILCCITASAAHSMGAFTPANCSQPLSLCLRGQPRLQHYLDVGPGSCSYMEAAYFPPGSETTAFLRTAPEWRFRCSVLSFRPYPAGSLKFNEGMTASCDRPGLAPLDQPCPQDVYSASNGLKISFDTGEKKTMDFVIDPRPLLRLNCSAVRSPCGRCAPGNVIEAVAPFEFANPSEAGIPGLPPGCVCALSVRSSTPGQAVQLHVRRLLNANASQARIFVNGEEAPDGVLPSDVEAESIIITVAAGQASEPRVEFDFDFSAAETNTTPEAASSTMKIYTDTVSPPSGGLPVHETVLPRLPIWLILGFALGATAVVLGTIAAIVKSCSGSGKKKTLLA